MRRWAMAQQAREHPILGDSYDVTAIAGMADAAAGKAVKKFINRKVDKLRSELESKPLESEQVIRYNLGTITGLKWVVEQIDEAASIVNKMER